MATRREFTLGALGLGAGWALSCRAGESTAAATPGVVEAGGMSTGFPGAVPAGELAARIALSAGRLTRGGVPAFSPEFVLADVALQPPRRFNEYSGDLSGRYLEALALLPPEGGTDLAGLVESILGHQRGDGRFGDPDLRYTADEIGGLHMAQLWGNGRLLLGLVQYHAVTGDAAALAAACRLADFLIGTRAQASEPAVVKRLLDHGAMGIICFTQLNEPLVLLAELTGEGRYLDEARKIGATLGERGTQHAHGYLTTARGMVALAEATGDQTLLQEVEVLYADLVASPDLLYLGGVPEFFGGDASGHRPRDEGCGVADFLRLSLMLHRATGKVLYLERAEHCLLNHLYFNQFATGDFGHRLFFDQGIAPTESVGRAWWCCTMHGYRAFGEVLDSVVRVDRGSVLVDLYLDFDWKGEGLEIAARTRAVSPLESRLVVEVQGAEGEAPLGFRRPSWAESMEIVTGRRSPEVDEHDGYLELRRLRPGDRIEVTFRHRARLRTRDGRDLPLEDLDGPVEGLLFLGPWLYVVDEEAEPLYFGEPWKGANRVLLPPSLEAPAKRRDPPVFAEPARHVAARYLHGGFPGTNPVTLRPIGEQTAGRPGTVATWITYTRG